MVLQKTVFRIPQMDCSCEEQLIRMKLDAVVEVKKLQFNLSNKTLTVYHEDGGKSVLEHLQTLGWDIQCIEHTRVDSVEIPVEQQQKKLLYVVLVINFLFFLIESIAGWWSHSVGLIADSLDMLADSLVYVMALLAVGKSTIYKKNIAYWAGWFQITLAVMGLIEVLKRFWGFEMLPDFKMMMWVSCLALMANVVCLYLLRQNGSQEEHMQASMIFTSNDVLVNLGVIVAGALVLWWQSPYPDLIVGVIVFAWVILGAIRILKLAR